MAKILTFRAPGKYERPANCFEINHNASLADIGSLVSEAIFHSDEGNQDSIYDVLVEIHSIIYPNSFMIKLP